MPFTYEAPTPRFAATIAEMIAHAADPQARAAEQIGQAHAQAIQQTGNAWAQAGQQIGQSIGQIPQQAQQMRTADQQQQIRAQQLQQGQMQLQAAQRQQQGQQAVAGMMQGGSDMPPGAMGPRQESFLGADGLFDVKKITMALGQGGYGDLAPELVKGAESINDSILKHQDYEQKAAQQKTIMIGDMADGALKLAKAGTPLLAAMDFVAQPALATQRFSPQDYAKIRGGIAALPPDKQQAALATMMDQAAKLGGEKSLGKDAQEVDRYGRVTASNIVPEKPNEAEIALKAAGGDPVGAMKLLKPQPNATAEQDDQRYRQIQAKLTLKQPVTPEDMAWADGYEKQKTLGVDRTAGAAADRQSATIAAQTAQQSRAQSFTEKQAGRKELTDKVETPFLTAQASANTLRDVVAAAKAGNKVAGSLQSLEATMTAIRAQGLNRINTAEIGVTKDAGSLWDNIVGYLGKKAEGQPVPANIQKDMTDFADILEKAAYQKYLAGHKATATRYGLDESPLPAPSVAQPAAPTAMTPGLQRLMSR